MTDTNAKLALVQSGGRYPHPQDEFKTESIALDMALNLENWALTEHEARQTIRHLTRISQYSTKGGRFKTPPVSPLILSAMEAEEEACAASQPTATPQSERNQLHPLARWGLVLGVSLALWALVITAGYVSFNLLQGWLTR